MGCEENEEGMMPFGIKAGKCWVSNRTNAAGSGTDHIFYAQHYSVNSNLQKTVGSTIGDDYTNEDGQ